LQHLAAEGKRAAFALRDVDVLQVLRELSIGVNASCCGPLVCG
jgi:hypothetical protein